MVGGSLFDDHPTMATFRLQHSSKLHSKSASQKFSVWWFYVPIHLSTWEPTCHVRGAHDLLTVITVQVIFSRVPLLFGIWLYLSLQLGDQHSYYYLMTLSKCFGRAALYSCLNATFPPPLHDVISVLDSIALPNDRTRILSPGFRHQCINYTLSLEPPLLSSS